MTVYAAYGVLCDLLALLDALLTVWGVEIPPPTYLLDPPRSHGGAMAVLVATGERTAYVISVSSKKRTSDPPCELRLVVHDIPAARDTWRPLRHHLVSQEQDAWSAVPLHR